MAVLQAWCTTLVYFIKILMWYIQIYTYVDKKNWVTVGRSVQCICASKPAVLSRHLSPTSLVLSGLLELFDVVLI